VPVGVLSIDTHGQPHRCRRTRDYLTPAFGFTDELRLVCRSHDTTWGLLALYRGEGGAPFTAGEGQLLASGLEVIADGVRRVLFAAPASGARSGGGSAVLIVNAAGQVTDMTAGASAVVEELGGWDHGSLPASVLAVTTSARTTNRSTTTRVPSRTGHWLTVRAMPLGGRVEGTSQSAATSAPVRPAEGGRSSLRSRPRRRPRWVR